MLKQKFKTLSLRLLLAIVAIMALPDVANATWYCRGTFNNWSGGEMELISASNGDFIYKIELSEISGKFKITNGTTWYGCNPSGSMPLYEKYSFYDTSGDCPVNTYTNVTVYFNDKDKSVYITSADNEGNDKEIYIVGADSSSLGDSWGNGKKMTYVGYGKYEINGLSSLKDEFKIRKGTSWVDNYQWSVGITDMSVSTDYYAYTNGGNMKMSNQELSNVTVTFDEATQFVTVSEVETKQLTGVELTGLDGVSVGDATISGDVYTWSFTYSGEKLAATVNVNETYDDGSVENATAAKTETFYNGSDYVITYNVETNELTITPTHKLVSVKCSLFENAASVAPYSWTYTHTGATAETKVTFTNVYTDASEEEAGSVTYTFVEGGVYTISYNNGSPTVTIVSEPKPVISTVTIVGDVAKGWSDTKVGNSVTDEDGDGIYEYSYTATSTENKYFNYYVTYSDGSGKYFVAVDNDNQDLSNSAKSYVEETNWRDCSFTYPFVNTGVYKVILNTNTETVSVQVISEPVEYAVYFYNDNNWSTVCAWVWKGGENYTGGTWPGQACTLIDSKKKLWKWTASEAIPEDAKIIFNNNDQGSQTSTFEWVNQAYYNPNGIVAGGDIEEDSTVQITGDEAGGWNSKKNMTQSQTQEGLYYYEFAQEDAIKYFSFFINDAQYAHTNGNMQLAVDVKYDLTADPETKNGRYYISKQSQYIYTVYVDVVAKKFWVSAVLDASYKSGIPVYPLGVATEGELASYDFANNPVYYLCSPVLNDNRISPEWQMVKEADGKFYIRGFAMRNTNARNNGDYLEEGKIKVVQFISAAQEEGTECVKISYNETGDSNPWSEGRLYDACYDPATGELTLTKVVDRMPFISMVGYNFQQLENYTTPRKSTTSRGWQEAWILYNENGEIVKDRNGNVLYSTMWPPKNPVYFNAVKGAESIELSSKNLTFTTDYAVKTGDVWEEELTDDAYNNLSLGSDTEYIRYKIDYMWILGATKIWTGWGGQSASWGSQWDNHVNWGFGSDTGNESGAAIDSQKSYTLAQNAGNFLVAEPTYFQTVEFFYNVANPSSSVFYTTLAHGNPSIRAKATADYYGNYDIEVKDAGGLAITAYTVTRYNAVTNEVDTANADNGAVKSETGDWTADTFNDETWVDDKELANGKYYYELTITIDGEEVTVYSNSFTIYRPADHQTEVKVMQLLELETSVNGAKYITVPVTTEGQLDETADLWYVAVDVNDAVTAVTAVSDPVSAREMIKNEMTAYDWTMKALVTSEVPASWTEEMDDTAADTMQDGTVTNWNLTINGTEVIKVAPNTNGNMLYIYDHSVPSTNSYKATMDYTYRLNDVAGTKATIGKETALTLEVPQAVAQAQELEVTRGTDATITGNVIPQNGEDEMLKLEVAAFTNPFYQPMDYDDKIAETEIEETNLQSADTYEQVDVTFKFTMPSISEEVYDKCVVAYMPKLTAYKDGAIVQQKYLSLVKDTKFGDAEKAITVTGINPTWEEVELSIATQYYNKEDKSSFVEGRFGTAPVMEQSVSFVANEILSVSGEVWQYERMERKEQEGQHYIGTGKFDLGVSNVTVSSNEGNAIIGGVEVSAPAYYSLGVNYNGNTFTSPYVFDGTGHDLGVLWSELESKPSGSVTLEVRPLYFFETISGMELTSSGLEEFDPAATPATASTVDNGTYVALYGKTNSVQISDIQTSVEDAVMGGAVVKAGQGYIEVIGAETSSVYSVSGAMLGNDESRYDVVPGVYVVIADGRAVKVVVR